MANNIPFPNMHAALQTLADGKVYFGNAPQGVTSPFIIWQLIDNAPGVTLSGLPAHDRQMIQMDAYTANPSQARTLAFNCRDKVESFLPVTSGPVYMGLDADTRTHRWMMEAEYIWQRA